MIVTTKIHTIRLLLLLLFLKGTTGGKPQLSAYFGSGETMGNFTLPCGRSQANSLARSIKPKTFQIFFVFIGEPQSAPLTLRPLAVVYYTIKFDIKLDSVLMIFTKA